MHKKTAGLLLGSAILAVASFSAFSFVKNKKADLVTFATYTNGDAATYYNSIDSTQSGNTLLTALRTLNLNKRKNRVGYSSMGTDPSGYFKYTDYDPDYVQYDSNGQPYGTKISSFYTYTSATSWNREHVWPNSHGGGDKGDTSSPYVDSDIHMPRPTISSENSSRGNSFFVEGMNSQSAGWDPYTAGYNANSRGEAARITFYCTLHDEKLILAPSNTTPSGTDPISGKTYGSGHTMGNLETLLKWLINYPVTQREKNRNEGAEYLQGNRNPFIDHPEYACKIWGSVNSTTQSLCNNASWSSDSVSISKYTASIAVNGTTTISATSSNNSTITWSTSDSNIVSISSQNSGSGSSITLTGIADGIATVTARATINSQQYSGTCTVTVGTGGSGGQGGDGNKVTITSETSGLTTTDEAVTLTEGGFSFGAKAKIYNSDKVWLTSNSGYIYNTTSFGKITKVTVNYATGGSATCSQALSFGTTTVSGHKNSAVNGTTFTTSTGGTSNYYEPTSDYGFFNLSITNNKNLQATSIEIEYDSSGGSGGEEEPTLVSISASGMTTNYNVGDTFSFNGVLKATYSDGNEEEVIPDSVSSPDMSTTGTKTITLTYEEGGITKTTTYTITVSESVTPPAGGDATYVVSEQGYSNETVVSSITFSVTTITGTLSKGSNNSNAPKYYTSGSAIRAYSGNTITINSTKANIYSIAFTFGSSDGSNAITANKGSYSNGTWNSTSGTYVDSVTFTIGGTSGNRRIAAISVNYYNASMFADNFLTGTVCNASGTTAPTVNWTTMSNKFDLLFTSDQETLQGATANQSGTNIEQAVARYDYIVGKYGKTQYSDFMGRKPSRIFGVSISFFENIVSKDNSLLIIIITSTITALAVGGYFFFRRKKDINE